MEKVALGVRIMLYRALRHIHGIYNGISRYPCNTTAFLLLISVQM